MRKSNALARFLKSEEGTTSVEYAGMLAFILLVLQMAVSALGSGTSDQFNQVSTALASANAAQSTGS